MKLQDATIAPRGTRADDRPVATLLIDEDAVTVSLSRAEKLEALQGDLRIPRSCLAHARVVSDGVAEVRGPRGGGLGIRGRALIGTFRQSGCTTLAVCHGQRPAIVLELVGLRFDRMVVTVADPQALVNALR
jgi:hypothetical protein